MIEKVSFTHFFKNIVTEKSIAFAFIFSEKNLMFDTVLKMINQIMKKLA